MLTVVGVCYLEKLPMTNPTRQDCLRASRPQVERSALSVGKILTLTKTFTADDVEGLARLTGDTNLLHLDEDVAGRTRFQGRIVPWTLLSGLISATIARLPCLPITLRENLEFLAPAQPGEAVTARCEIVETVGERKYRLRCNVANEADDVLVEGESIVFIDTRTETDDPAHR